MSKEATTNGVNSVSMSAIIGGALASWNLTSDTPASLLAAYTAFLKATKEIDPTCKFQESFPTYGKGSNFGGASKEVEIVSASCDFGKFSSIFLVAKEDDKGDSATISLSKESVEKFRNEYATILGNATFLVGSIEKIEHAIKKGSKIMLSGSPLCSVSYSVGKDGTTNWLKEFKNA